ncbi:hypothetical protein [Solihabitans fulvus]|uniref:hypothetical protein n=1 Tax=Solihabitans fulvus TaxID=1892852 RepID=UPI001661D8F5|nr:hypothetical protein [Solihabitans fulvus]
MLELIDKRIDPSMTRTVVRRLTERGINVKSYAILGFPAETAAEIDTTVRLVHDLWELGDDHRCRVVPYCDFARGASHP